MTLSCQGKAKDSEGHCFALDETSDAIQNRTKIPVVKRLKDTRCIYTKTENDPHHSFSVVTSVMSMQVLKTTLTWLQERLIQSQFLHLSRHYFVSLLL